MAFFAYNKLTNGIESGAYATAAEVPTPNAGAEHVKNRHHEDEGIVVLEYPDYDPSVDQDECIRINAAGTALENPNKSKTKAEQVAVDKAFRDGEAAKTRKLHKRGEIKWWVKQLIEETAWEDIRANDTDVINGNDDAKRALYLKRKKIRDQGNATEAALIALTDLEEIRKFNVRPTNQDGTGWYKP